MLQFSREKMIESLKLLGKTEEEIKESLGMYGNRLNCKKVIPMLNNNEFGIVYCGNNRYITPLDYCIEVKQ